MEQLLKYKLNVGDISQYDIQAPRDINNTLKTKQNAEENADQLDPVIIDIENANSDMLNDAYEYFDELEKFILSVKEDGQIGTINDKIQRIDTLENYTVLLELDDTVLESIFTSEGKENLEDLKKIVIRDIIPGLTKKNLMDDNIAIEIASALQVIEGKGKIAPLEPIAVDILQKVIKPNSRVDEKATSARREAYIESYIMENPVIIYKDERISVRMI